MGIMNRFITFEGIDGSGKTTQIEMLKSKLSAKGEKVVSFREPGGTKISETIRRILLSNQNSNLTDASEALLFFASRSQLLAEKITPFLEKEYFVICDRFNDSTIAYQGYGKSLSVEDLDYISKYSTDSFMPQLTFFLDISVDLSIRRRELKSNDRIENKGHEYLKRVRSGFIEIANKNPNRFIVIDGSEGIEDVSKKIWEIISDKYAIK